MNNPFDIMKLDSTCTNDELEARYLELKVQYAEDRFLEGEDGRKGAENLSRLEEAYLAIKRTRTQEAHAEAMGGEDFDVIDNMIKQGSLDEAQTALDATATRNGRWHYLQAIIYYKRNWFTDSLRQLNVAISLEPNNTQYQHSKEMLERNMNGNVPPSGMGAPTPNYGQGQNGVPPTQAPDDAMGMATCCQTICCMDCLCNAVRCIGCGG